MQTGINYFIGIELSGSRKGFTCALLSAGLKIEYLGMLTPLEWQTVIENGRSVIAAVNSPLTMNLGYMDDTEYRTQLKVAHQSTRTRNLRVCEYRLMERGIACARSPKDVAKFSLSLQRSLKFTAELGMLGFQFWPTAGAGRQMMETHADAAFSALLGVKPFAAASLEGRIQRQLLLQARGVAVPDAMEFFEEVTRHRLLSGKLPQEMILAPAMLNALVSAYTAWIAVSRPGEYTLLGEPEEGMIILPASRKPDSEEQGGSISN